MHVVFLEDFGEGRYILVVCCDEANTNLVFLADVRLLELAA